MSKTLIANDQQKTKQHIPLRWQVGLSFFAFILIGANDGAVGVLLPSLNAYYHIDKATISQLFLSGTIGYLIAAFNSGLLVEKLGTRLFLMLGALSFLLGVSIFSLHPSFIFVLLALLPLGFGSAIIDAGLNSYIARLPQSTATLNYLHAFYGAGALLGPIIASTILTIGGSWNNVYYVWGGMTLVLLVGFGVLFNNSAQTAQTQREKKEANVLLSALRLRVVWIAALFLLFYVGTEVSLGSWSYTFLTEERHGPALFSGWVVSGYWLGLTLGRLILARVAQNIGTKRLIQACLLGVVIGVLLVWLAPIEIVSASGLLLTGFSLGPIFPTTIALMSNLVSARLLPSAIGFLASLGSMGAALFPWLAGNLAQHIGLWSLLPYTIGLTGVMVFLWLLLQNRSQTTSVVDNGPS